MKKIYESPLNGWSEKAERVHVFALENDDEFWEIYNMTHGDKCDYFGVFDEFGYDVAPGALYNTYDFSVSSNHVIMYETFAYNV